MKLLNTLLVGTLAAFAAVGADAHVMLMPAQVSQGASQDFGIRVGHPCKEATATTALTVRVPEGFALESAAPVAGWHLENAGSTVTWQAESPAAWLGPEDHAMFMLRGRATSAPGVLYFRIRQTCDKGSVSWADVPAADVDKPEFPAARLEVLPPFASR